MRPPPRLRRFGETSFADLIQALLGLDEADRRSAKSGEDSSGAIRTGLGDYRLAFQIAGVLCLMAGASFVLIGRRALARPTPPREDRLSVASA